MRPIALLTQGRYEIVIKPNRNWLRVDWAGLFHYRDLLLILVRRDFISKYKQTMLGPAWFVLQPLLTSLVFVAVFGIGIKISTQGLPPFLFYLCALLPWGYFVQCLNPISQSLSSNAHILGKVYFPRLIIPLSIVFSNMMAWMVQLLTFLGFYLAFKFFTPAGALIHPNAWVMLVPIFLLETALLSLGLGLWIAALTIRYRDFQHLVGFLTQLWMYATPIIYPASLIPAKWRFILLVNPMAPIVEFHRYAFFGTGELSFVGIGISFATTLVLLTSGVLMFNKVERSFVDSV